MEEEIRQTTDKAEVVIINDDTSTSVRSII